SREPSLGEMFLEYYRERSELPLLPWAHALGHRGLLGAGIRTHAPAVDRFLPDRGPHPGRARRIWAVDGPAGGAVHGLDRGANSTRHGRRLRAMARIQLLRDPLRDLGSRVRLRCGARR